MVNVLEYLKRKQKGQGIVEYALLLAFVVGIAMMLNGTNLGGAVKGVFDDVAMVLGGGSKNKYAAAFDKWHDKSKEWLIANTSSEERYEADKQALQNIADFLIGKTDQELIDYGIDTSYNRYKNNNWNEGARIFADFDVENGNQLTYYKGGLKDDQVLNWMYGSTYDNSANIISRETVIDPRTYSSARYFYSDGMIADIGNTEKKVMVHVSFGDDGKVTTSRVWVETHNQANNADLQSHPLDVTATKK